MQIYIRILAFVNSNLSGSHNNNTVLDGRYMSRASHVTDNDQGIGDILQSQACEWSAFGGRCRHIYNASA